MYDQVRRNEKTGNPEGDIAFLAERNLWWLVLHKLIVYISLTERRRDS